MGIYVNPTNGMEKEEFLAKYGEQTTFDEVVNTPPDYKTKFPVVLVNNGFFTAAAVITDGLELTNFYNPHDNRPKMMFLVDAKPLLEFGIGVSSELEHFKVFVGE